MKFNNKEKECGFTLIEMLVVISLVGMLAALSLISFTSSQKQARDTNRKSDLKQYQSALESYANLALGLYPSRTGNTVSAATTLCNDLNAKLEPDITCSQDPKNARDSTFAYYYQSNGTNDGTGTATAYVLWAKLESFSTTTYWVVCSTGETGWVSSGIPSTAGVCPI